MLTPDEAQERLKRFQVVGLAEQRGAAVKRLPATARQIAEGVYNPRAWLDSLLAGGASPVNLAELLAQLPHKDRRRLFEALFPNMAQHVERAWELIGRGVYQAGWMRTSFRAPGTPSLYAGQRVQWLTMLSGALEGYQPSVVWLAAWAPHLGPLGAEGAVFGTLLAAAIDGGGSEGEQVFEILRQSAAGEHEIGAMGRHVIRAFSLCSRPEAWDYLERLLLAAQREEGLRQSILEQIDEGHPEALRRMLKLILDHGLARFSAVIRAADVWFGYGYEALAQPAVEHAIGRVLTFLDDEAAREAALGSEDAPDVHLALWSLAWGDAMVAMRRAADCLHGATAEKRFVGLMLLRRLGIDLAARACAAALSDPDLRIAASAAQAIRRELDSIKDPGLYDQLAALVLRLPAKKTKLPALVYPWWEVEAHSTDAAYLLIEARGRRPIEELFWLLPHLDASMRHHLVTAVKPNERQRPAVRSFLLERLGDASSDVRDAALAALKGLAIGADDAPTLEALLTRKANDLRRAALHLLLNQPDGAALASADRLLAAKDALQRLAGLELLREMATTQRAESGCRQRATAYRDSRETLSSDEQGHLAVLTAGAGAAPSTADGFGLFEPARLTPALVPRKLPLTARTPAAIGLIESLLAKLDELRETPVTLQTWEGEVTQPLAVAHPWQPPPQSLPKPERTLDRLPLMPVWLEWYEQRSADMRDADGCELARALWLWHLRCNNRSEWLAPWYRRWFSHLLGDQQARPEAWVAWVEPILSWLCVFDPHAGAPSVLLDAAEAALALTPSEAFQPYREVFGWTAPPIDLVLQTVEPARLYRQLAGEVWSPEELGRLYRLQRWVCERSMQTEPARTAKPERPGWLAKLGRTLPGAEAVFAAAGGNDAPPRNHPRPSFEDAVAAFAVSAVGDDDILDHFVGDHGDQGRFIELYGCSGRQLPAYAAEVPALARLLERVRERLLAVELARGDQPSAATPVIAYVRAMFGAETMVRLLRGVGKDGFRRATWGDQSKGGVLSRLLRVCYVRPEDTPSRVADLVRQAGLPEQALCDAALVAPQWSAHLAEAVGWEGFESGVWWLYAHTKDDRWSVEPEVREGWAAKVSEHTPLSSQELLDGAVDVAWFHRAHAALGEQRWKRLYDAAKFGSSGTGHARARLFADAMLGCVTVPELVGRIRDKRNQDVLRALGLVPLPEGEARDADVLARYEVIQEFLRTTKQFGAQRQESEKRAGEVAMDNLARTAGFPDPLRLQWAMEARATADLQAGPITVTSGAVEVSLSITADGRPELGVMKAGKALKSVPAPIAKEPAVKALRDRKTALDRAGSRMKAALELSMCRGDRFTGRELSALLEHPLLAPSLKRLVWLGEGTSGYPAEAGQALRGADGELQPLGRDEPVRLAHAVDLLAGGRWHEWQRECFLAQRVQPFKQVFREVYVVTETERAEAGQTRRYAGHQVQPRQALALLGQRGWVHNADEGVRKTWHEAGLTAWLEFQEPFWTPAEVEGLTLEAVRFMARGQWQPVPVDQVPPALFSEAMRDLDLVVSVAHRGGVDPEATASSVELRAALLTETCRLLQIDNVRIDGRFAHIEGKLGRYSVHLGSAVAHRQPGAMIVLVPVHGQHRGRLFLPFADDDPKTAEVLSKILLLARDNEIRDPTVLAYLRGPTV